MVHAHLHHTLNCLVGPNGMDFDKDALNPCKNAGNGAIPDTTDAAKQKALEAAADKARAGTEGKRSCRRPEGCLRYGSDAEGDQVI